MITEAVFIPCFVIDNTSETIAFAASCGLTHAMEGKVGPRVYTTICGHMRGCTAAPAVGHEFGHSDALSTAVRVR